MPKKNLIRFGMNVLNSVLRIHNRKHHEITISADRWDKLLRLVNITSQVFQVLGKNKGRNLQISHTC